EAQAAMVRRPGDPGPGPRLGEVVSERLGALGASAEDARWDSTKRGDGSWQVQLVFGSGGRVRTAEWVYDPRRRHATPGNDGEAARAPATAQPGRRAAGGRARRAPVPSWDEIMFGSSRPRD